MYKTASRRMQHALRIDTIDPSKGFVHHDIEPDFIPSADNMDEVECRSEMASLSREMVRVEQALAIAKRERDREQIIFLGHQIQALIKRRMPIKKRLWHLEQQWQGHMLGEVVKEMLDAETQKMIFDEMKRRREARP